MAWYGQLKFNLIRWYEQQKKKKEEEKMDMFV